MAHTLNDNDTLSAPSQDERIHACINPETEISQDGNLFSTTGLDFIRRDDARKTFIKGQTEKFTASIGDERRLAEFARHDSDKTLWAYPEELPKTFLSRQ